MNLVPRRPGQPEAPVPVAPSPGALNHPDAQRRFWTITSQEELERALDYPWEKWTIFLHPIQRKLVERVYNGPARVSGSAGTGKTIIALHRTVHLARTNRDSRVLLYDIFRPVSKCVEVEVTTLISNEPRLGERIEVHGMNSIGRRLHDANIGKAKIVSAGMIRELLWEGSRSANANRFSLHFLETEWEQVVDGWQLDTWESCHR